ncbi:MAG: hypothetical protein HFK06_00925 [Clostridia bacterium]|jgi:hypothetical protein|nr:hypothetical protein [Clostridia bacterium]
MDTKEIVTELYALRAGLSFIAREKDAYDTEIATAERAKSNEIFMAHTIVDEKTKSKRRLESELNKVSDAHKALETKYYDEYRYINKYDIEEAKEDLKIKKKITKIRIVFGIIFLLLQLGFAGLAYVHIYIFNMSGLVFIPIIICLLIICISVVIWEKYGFEGKERCGVVLAYLANIVPYIVLMIRSILGGTSLSTFLFVLTVVATIPAIYITGYSIFDCYDDDFINIHNADKNIEKLEKRPQFKKELDDAYAAKTALKQQLDKCNDDIQTAENDYQVNCKKINEQYLKTCAALLKPHSKIASDMWNTLVKNYGNLLDVRDWHILDLIIWQLETGRAETIKEALQLADRETQTDRIVRVVASASEAICKKIQFGFGSLQAQLDNNIAALSRSFAESAHHISDRIDQGMASVAALGENQTNNMLAMDRNLEKIVSQSSLQVALLEKANTSSEKLITEVNKLNEVHKDE